MIKSHILTYKKKITSISLGGHFAHYYTSDPFAYKKISTHAHSIAVSMVSNNFGLPLRKDCILDNDSMAVPGE